MLLARPKIGTMHRSNVSGTADTFSSAWCANFRRGSAGSNPKPPCCLRVSIACARVLRSCLRPMRTPDISDNGVNALPHTQAPAPPSPAHAPIRRDEGESMTDSGVGGVPLGPPPMPLCLQWAGARGPRLFQRVRVWWSAEERFFEGRVVQFQEDAAEGDAHRVRRARPPDRSITRPINHPPNHAPAQSPDHAPDRPTNRPTERTN